MPSKRDHYHARAHDRLLTEIRNPANLRLAEDFLTTRRRKDAAPASLVNYLRTFVRWERFLGNRCFREATAQDVSSFLASFQQQRKAATAALYSKSLLAFYNWSLGDETMKRSFREAFRVPEPPGRTLMATDEEFARMLNACVGSHDRALLWLLRDGGPRIGEVQISNVRDFTFDDQGGVTLNLLEKKLKTRESNRLIYMTRCVPILKAHFADHPCGDEKTAPFMAYRQGDQRGQRMEHIDLDGLIRRARARSGVGKNVTAHVFRHTRATELVRLGWPLQKINRYMGWSKTSRMHAKYVHLVNDDIVAQVRRDAGYMDPPVAIAPILATPPVAALQPAVSADVAAFAQAFGLAWKLAHAGTGSVPVPPGSDCGKDGDGSVGALVATVP